MGLGDLLNYDYYGDYAPMTDPSGIDFGLPSGTYYSGADALAPDFVGDNVGVAGSDGSGLYPSGTLYNGTNAVQGDFMTDPAGAPRTPATGDFSQTPSGATYTLPKASSIADILKNLAKSALNGAANGGGGSGSGGNSLNVAMPHLVSPTAEKVGAAPMGALPQTAAPASDFKPLVMDARPPQDMSGLARLFADALRGAR